MFVVTLFFYLTIARTSVCFCHTVVHRLLNDDNSVVCTSDQGEGNFRDPIEILGKDFTHKIAIHLCESQMLLYAEEVREVKFTARGKKTCADVCCTYQKKMILDEGVDTQLLQSACNYIGSEDCSEKIGLGKRCNCVFAIRCRQRAEVIIYTFSPDCHGFLKVAVYENKFHHYIT